MIYYLNLFFQRHHPFITFLSYPLIRSIGGLLTGVLLFLIFSPYFIKKSKDPFSSKARKNLPKKHQKKVGIPATGGILTILVTIITTLLWGKLNLTETWIFLACLILFGILGLWDDYRKIKYNAGITIKQKFLGQIILALTISATWFFLCSPATSLNIPFLKSFQPNLGLFLIPWAAFIIIATSNAVNLTDGLDGLAISSLIPNFILFSIIIYFSAFNIISSFPKIPFYQSELMVVGGSLIGTSIGFFWYNIHPAKMFMGDVGSLSLGAGLALFAVISKQEMLLILTGGIFVIETISVIIQIFTYKFFKKRFFKMAPLHHHLELKGWRENIIVIIFSIITIILCIIAFLILN